MLLQRRRRVSFSRFLSGSARSGRRPTTDDLQCAGLVSRFGRTIAEFIWWPRTLFLPSSLLDPSSFEKRLRSLGSQPFNAQRMRPSRFRLFVCFVLRLLFGSLKGVTEGVSCAQRKNNVSEGLGQVFRNIVRFSWSL